MRGECQPGNDHLVYQGAKATVVQLNISEFTIADLQRSIPKYSGANLIITSIPKVWIMT